MRKLVLVDTRCCFFQEAPLAASMNGRFPLGKATGISQYESRPIVLIAGAGKCEYGGETEAEEVVTPFVCSCQYGCGLIEECD